MALVKVKEKFQVTLPVSVRERAGIGLGDILEIKVRGRKITLTPKSAIDRELAKSLDDFKAGRFIGPFKTARSAIRALRRAAK